MIASIDYACATVCFAKIVKVTPIFVTYRATVAPADCDHLAHMNVQHYFAAASDGMFGIMVRLGLGPEEIRRPQMAFAVVHAETDFITSCTPQTSSLWNPPSLSWVRSPRTLGTALKMSRPAILQ